MLKTVTSFIFLGSFLIINALPNYENSIQDTCVVSLTIPRDSIKSSCDTQDGLLRKIQSMEAQFRRITGKIMAMEHRLPQIFSESAANREKTEELKVNFAKEDTKMNQRIQKIESVIQNLNSIGQEERSEVNLHPISEPDTYLDPVRPYLANEIQKIKEEIMESLSKQLMAKISEQAEEVGSSDVDEESKITVTNSEYTVTEYDLPNNINLNPTEEQTTPINKNNLDLLARSVKNLYLQNSTSFSKGNNSENGSIPNNGTGEQTSEMSMSLIQDVIETTADILRGEVKQIVLEMKENEMAMLTSNISEIMSKIKVFENSTKRNNNEMKILQTNQSAFVSDIKNGFNLLENQVEILARKVDGPLNDISIDSRLQQRFETMGTNINKTMKNKFLALTRPLEIRLEQQDRKINMSTTFVNIFSNTLNNNFNSTNAKLHKLETNIHKLQQNVTSLKIASHDGGSYEQRIQDIEAQVQEVPFMQMGFTVFKQTMNQMSRDTENSIQNLDLKVQKLEHNLTLTMILAQKTEKLEETQAKFTDDLQMFHGALYGLKSKLILDNGDWLQYNFSHSIAKVGCNNGQYVKRNKLYGDVAKYVGVVLCSPVRYKIFLGNSLDGEFLDIADRDGHGEDHCEYVGAESESGVNVDRTFSFPGGINVYLRYRWGEKPNVGMLSPIFMTPSWYECGIQIP